MKLSELLVGGVFALNLVLMQPLQAADWPQWRGANRDGKSPELGLLQEWPTGGPKLVWKATGVGKGFAGITVAGEHLYTMGDLSGASHVIAIGADGTKVLWNVKVGAAGAPGWGDFEGPRCTPTVAGDLVFAVDQWGELICVTAKDGKEQWRKNYEKDFGAPRPEWGFSESPLVDGDRVILFPGGSKGAMVALDKLSGKLIWQSKGLTDEAQYASIVAAEIGGQRQYITISMKNVLGIQPNDGAVLWTATRKGSTAVIPTPIVEGNQVYVTSSYGTGCNLFDITVKDGKFSAKQVYANKVMANHHGGVIKVGDHIYGYSEGKGFVCQNFKTGESVWSEKAKLKKGAVSYADGMLYCREEDSGAMVLVQASPAGFVEKGRFAQPDRNPEKAWPHPTIANGRLYLRDQDIVLCYDISTKGVARNP